MPVCYVCERILMDAFMIRLVFLQFLKEVVSNIINLSCSHSFSVIMHVRVLSHFSCV